MPREHRDLLPGGGALDVPRRMMPRPTGSRSTASVLWLMILLVFLPIAAAHGVARYVDLPVAVR